MRNTLAGLVIRKEKPKETWFSSAEEDRTSAGKGLIDTRLAARRVSVRRTALALESSAGHSQAEEGARLDVSKQQAMFGKSTWRKKDNFE